MRQVVYSVAMSLDGHIAASDGSYDWIPQEPDFDFGAQFDRFDAFIIGRKTFQSMGERAHAIQHPTFVISRSLHSDDCAGANLSSDVAATIRELKSLPGKDIWLFGGGELFRSMLELSLVDAVEVSIIPVLLGNGLPLLPSTETRTQLILTNVDRYEKSGMVRLSYIVRPTN
jgi:dihydrofolate reductase